MSFWFQTNAGGSVGSTVAAASGGSADGSTPYDIVGTGSGTTLVYDTTHQLFGSDVAIKVATSTSAVLAYAGWSTSITEAVPMSISACFYFTAIPTAQVRLLTILTGSSLMCAINVTTSTGTLQITDGTGATNLTSVIPLNQWFRVELKLIASSTSVGQVEARFFPEPFDVTPMETKTTAASRNTIGGTPTSVRFGQGVGAANIVPYWFTQAQASNTTTYPPAPVPPSGVITYGWGGQATGGTYAGNGSSSGTIAPPAASAGDLLFCVASVSGFGTSNNEPTISAPTGWTQLGSTFIQGAASATASLVTGVFFRWATGTDPSVSFTWDASVLYHWAVQLGRLVGGSGTGTPTITFAGDSTSGTGNTAPTTSPTGTVAILEIFSERSSTNTTYTNSSGSVTRISQFGSGGGAADILVTSRLMTSGTVGGDAVTAGTAGGVHTSAVIVLPSIVSTPSTASASLSISGTTSDVLNFPVTGNATASVSATGTIATDALKFPTTGTSTATVSATGTIAADALKFPTTGTSTATVSATGTIAADALRFAESATAAVTVAGTTNDVLKLATGATATASVSGTTADALVFPVSATATALVAGTVSADVLKFIITATAALVVAGTATPTPPVFTSTATAAASVAGTTADVLKLVSTATAAAAVNGTTANVLTFPASATATAIVAGTATDLLGAPATATASATVTGTASDALSYVETATGSATVAGTATNTLKFASLATAAATVAGTATDTSSFTQAATATATATVSGTTSDVLKFAVTATATAVVAGTAADVLTPPSMATTATAALVASGTANTGSTSPTTATASASVAGTATGTAKFTATATAALSAAGTASDTATTTGASTATASATVAGSAGDVLKLSATATASATVGGTSTGVLTTQTPSTATASLTVTGSAADALTISATALAALIAEGVAGAGTAPFPAEAIAVLEANGISTGSLNSSNGFANLSVAGIIRTAPTLVSPDIAVVLNVIPTDFVVTQLTSEAVDVVVSDIQGGTTDVIVVNPMPFVAVSTVQVTLPPGTPDDVQTRIPSE